MGTAVAQWLRCCATYLKLTGSIPDGVIETFIDIKSFRSHYGPWVDSASKRNQYQEYPGGKRGQCVMLTSLPPSCAVVMKSGNLKFLEPSGPLQACKGIAVPLPFYNQMDPKTAVEILSLNFRRKTKPLLKFFIHMVMFFCLKDLHIGSY